MADDDFDGCTAISDWSGSQACDVSNVPVGGFCGTLWDCGEAEFEEFCFTDDELYRAFLKSRRYQLRKDWRRETLVEAVRGLFGASAFIVDERPGVIRVSAGRPLSESEKATLHLFRQVLPVAPGVRVDIVGQVPGTAYFGFGTGWGGVCDGVWAG